MAPGFALDFMGFQVPFYSIDNRDVTGIGNAEFSHCAPEVESRSNLALINLNKDFATSTSWRATVGRQMAVQAGKRSDSGKPVY